MNNINRFSIFTFSDVILYINAVASPCSGSKVCLTILKLISHLYFRVHNLYASSKHISGVEKCTKQKCIHVYSSYYPLQR